MKTVELNDFTGFFREHKHIRLVCLNGAKAADIYLKRVLRTLPAGAQAIPHTILPSTSPAHAGMPLARKLALWREAISGAKA
jgi:G:T/U-mismatch repair DNA glycosylase